ncbi:MAG: manganese efflux pump [Myxococcales bacterium]|nr:manganese efflux pump [Myxococcales bacterium]
MIEALLLAIGLAMDASAVAAARGARARSLADRDLLVLPLLFGAFQAGMAAIGWQGAAWSLRYIDSWDHWLAFFLLVLIGGKMLREGLRQEQEETAAETIRGSLAVDLSLAVATSLDAAAAGVSLPSIPTSPLVSVGLIGAVTAGLSALAFVVGWRIGNRLGRAATALGGVVLIGIGVRLLVAALTAG